MEETKRSISCISANRGRSFAIKNGRLYAWGDNWGCKLGLGTELGRSPYISTPQPIGNRSDWEMVFSRDGQTLGIRAGELWAWGTFNSTRHASGGPFPLGGMFRVSDRSDWEKVSIGGSFTVALAGGRLFQWANRDTERFGLKHGPASRSILQIDESPLWSEIAAGRGHFLAIKDGRLFAWGRNSFGRLGTGDSADRDKPVQIHSESGWTHVAAEDNQSFAIRNGELYSWGRNNSAQLLDCKRRVLARPEKANANRRDFLKISVEKEHCLAIANGSIFSWGGKEALSGAGGRGSTSMKAVRVDDSFDWEDVSCGVFHAIAVRDDRLFSWGDNSEGQLGVGDFNSRMVPTEVFLP